MRALHLDNSYDPIMLKDACMNNDFNTIKILMEKYNLQKEDILMEDIYGNTALHHASFRSNLDIFNMLIEKYHLQKKDIMKKNKFAQGNL